MIAMSQENELYQCNGSICLGVYKLLGLIVRNTIAETWFHF